MKQQQAEEMSTETRASKKRLRSEMSMAKTLTCKNGHAMEKRTTNPVGYANQAACDVCGLEHLPKKKKFFFHCSFCKWDICPKCSEERLTSPKCIAIPTREREDEDDMRLSSKKQKKRAQQMPLGDASGFTKARREIWLPTDSSAVNRAPVEAEIVNSWVEGMPV